MGWVYAFWVLGALALVGTVADALAIKRSAGCQVATAALLLKGSIIAVFAGWWIYFQLVRPQAWEDLASLLGIIVLAVPALLAAIILDALAIRKLRSATKM